jgi:import inner membrane translocase subunit TIM23
MGLLDAFRGSSAGKQREDASSSGSDVNAEPQSEQFSSDSFQTTDFASGPSFSTDTHSTQDRYYNPYEGISAALDRRDVKQPFRLPQEPEFLFSEESVVQRRSWSENLTYYTGVGYMAGAFAGGSVGLYRVLGPSPSQGGAAGGTANLSGLSQRMRVNQLLNTSGKMGRTAGNALGVLGLVFSSSESLYYYLNDRILPEDLMTVAAGATTGMIYRSVRGPRQALAAGAVGSIFGTLLLGLRAFVSPGL